MKLNSVETCYSETKIVYCEEMFLPNLFKECARKIYDGYFCQYVMFCL